MGNIGKVPSLRLQTDRIIVERARLVAIITDLESNLTALKELLASGVEVAPVESMKHDPASVAIRSILSTIQPAQETKEGPQ